MIKGTPIAKCFIKNEDRGNCLYLSDQEFVIVINNKDYHYSIDELHSLHWVNKNLLLPITSGGIIVCLSVVAYMNDIIHPWIFMPVLLTGILVLYYGFIGAPALILSFQKHQEQYLLKELNTFLREFTDFVNFYLLNKNLPDYYIHLEPEQYNNAKATGTIKINQPLELSLSPEKEDGKTTWRLDIMQLQKSVTYTRIDQNNELKPYVTDEIPLSAISPVG